MRRPLYFSAGLCMLAGALFASSCKPPRYIQYQSSFGDYTVQVPWGWNVYVDQQGQNFTNYTFVGQFDQDFFNGVPSLSIRWYRTNSSIPLRDNTYERYASADDYINQNLRDVYGPDRRMAKNINRVSISGWEGKHFIVESIADVPENYTFGVAIDPETNRHGIIRKHEYVVLPMDSGFYVLVYPATRQGYDHHIKKFNNLVNTFAVLTDGPAGEKLR